MPQPAGGIAIKDVVDQDVVAENVATRDVAIVGAGPVGLCLALELAARGWSVLVVDLALERAFELLRSR